jgi:hypothetical protein
LRPETISRTTTPKLNTSALVERSPCMRYSGAMYPLVPATRVCTRERPSPASGKSLAIPKSAILATQRSSRRMLLALMSRWMMDVCASSWRYSRPPRPAQLRALRQVSVAVSAAGRVEEDLVEALVGDVLVDEQLVVGAARAVAD